MNRDGKLKTIPEKEVRQIMDKTPKDAIWMHLGFYMRGFEVAQLMGIAYADEGLVEGEKYEYRLLAIQSNGSSRVLGQAAIVCGQPDLPRPGMFRLTDNRENSGGVILKEHGTNLFDSAIMNISFSTRSGKVVTKPRRVGTDGRYNVPRGNLEDLVCVLQGWDGAVFTVPLSKIEVERIAAKPLIRRMPEIVSCEAAKDSVHVTWAFNRAELPGTTNLLMLVRSSFHEDYNVIQKLGLVGNSIKIPVSAFPKVSCELAIGAMGSGKLGVGHTESINLHRLGLFPPKPQLMLATNRMNGASQSFEFQFKNMDRLGDWEYHVVVQEKTPSFWADVSSHRVRHENGAMLLRPDSGIPQATLRFQLEARKKTGSRLRSKPTEAQVFTLPTKALNSPLYLKGAYQNGVVSLQWRPFPLHDLQRASVFVNGSQSGKFPLQAGHLKLKHKLTPGRHLIDVVILTNFGLKKRYSTTIEVKQTP